jgi:UDP-glucose 4-epimerase
MKKVLVTGVTGSVGQVLARRLAEAGFAVRAASRQPLPSGLYAETAILPRHDAPPSAFHALVDGVEHVVHAAALTNADRTASEEAFMNANTRLSTALAAAATGAVPGRFIFLSSIRAVAGAGDGRRIDDNIVPAPADPYGRSKRAAEIAIGEEYDRQGCSSRLVILRPAPVYGKGMKGGLAAMSRLADSPYPLPFGSFRNRRSLLCADALAEAVLHLLRTDPPLGRNFVISDRSPITIAEIFRSFRRGFGRSEHLIGISPAVIKIGARLAGKEEAWKRLFSDEICDPSGLVATGWQAADSREGLQRLAQALKNGH